MALFVLYQFLSCLVAWIVLSESEPTISTCNGQCSTFANVSIRYDFVSSDEIVVLQNAIEDDMKISNMTVKKESLHSHDVLNSPANTDASAISSTEIFVNWTRLNENSYVKVNGTKYYVRGYTVFVKQYGYSKWNRHATDEEADNITIGLLQPYTLYTLRMLAYHAGGNGIATEFVDVKTLEGVPSAFPAEFTATPQSPTEIALEWQALPVVDWKGFAKGYMISFIEDKKYKPEYKGPLPNITVAPAASTVTLRHLKPFTSYRIFIRAMTSAGQGPRDVELGRTEEGIPSVGARITYAELDPKRPQEAEVRWERIPADKINGELKGYTLFWGKTRDGKDRREYPTEVNEIKLDEHTHIYRIKNLEIDVEIKIWVVGRTNVGKGLDTTAQPAYIETCKCPQSVYAAWFDNPPYAVEQRRGKEVTAEGIFPDYLHQMVESLCGECNALKGTGATRISTKLYWDRSKDGHSPMRKDEKTLKELVGNGVHFHVAVNGRSEVQNFQSDYKFVCIIHSPGIAFIVRDPLLELNKTMEIMNSLAKCWPAIIIIILFSMVSGIIMWVLDCKENQEEFPNESFLQGLYHGTYWAFVSMTTVGYGDKTPRSFLAQCVAICWMLMGPIINGIVIGAITTSLTTISLQSDPKIYGSMVGAKADSFEYNLGVRRNAKMNPTGEQYTTTDELIEALDLKHVDGILVDSLVAHDLADQITEKKMKISKIIAEKAGWGIVLSSSMLKLEEEIRSYEANRAEEMRQKVQNRTKNLNVKSGGDTELDTGLVDPRSETFLGIVTYGCIAIAVCILLAVIFEYVILKFKTAKIVPYTEAHRTLLEGHISRIITEFCDSVPDRLKLKTDEHESELKRFFWKKGYSFGIDGWLRQKTSDEEKIKKEIRYQEIMNEDLGAYKPQIVWSQPKTIVKTLKHEVKEVKETIKSEAEQAKERIKETIDDII